MPTLRERIAAKIAEYANLPPSKPVAIMRYKDFVRIQRATRSPDVPAGQDHVANAFRDTSGKNDEF